MPSNSPYGLKPHGFVRKPYEQILADIEARQRARIGPNIDQSSSSPLGQENATVAREISLLWEVAEQIANGWDPDKAEDYPLEALSKLTGVAREAAKFSVVRLRCTLTAGTTIVAGSHFASVAGNAKSRWTPVANFTAPTDGVHDVDFRAEFRGPVSAALNTITVIATPVIGWTAVINSATAVTVGKNVDTNTELRLRREKSLQKTGKATARAIRAALIAVPGVVDAWVLANKGFVTDSNGVPGYHVECVIFDGLTPLANNAAIAAAIYDTISPNTPTFGGTTVTTKDVNGDDIDIRFTRVTVRPVWLDYVLTTGEGYVGDTEVQNYVAVEAAKRFGVGADLVALRLRSLPLSLAGVEDVTSLELGLSASPSGTANVPIGPREIAVFDPSRITVSS